MEKKIIVYQLRSKSWTWRAYDRDKLEVIGACRTSSYLAAMAHAQTYGPQGFTITVKQ